MQINLPLLKLAARDARGLAMDAVAKAQSGHLGLPLGAADMGAVLFGHALSFDPAQPRWWNRDRFVLSAGHGSMFLYAWLHLSGFKVSLEDLKQFRQLHSITPGHPEFGETDGVECTTGPLGQGIGNAIGLAMSGKMLQSRFNTPEHPLFDYHVIALAGDGCLQEGVAAESAAYAGHLGLDNLILIYDDNRVTLDAAASKSQSEDTALRFQAYGFDVEKIDGHDMVAFAEALARAKQNDNGKPKLLMAHTEIGRGIPEVAGTHKAHGEAGVKFVAAARQALGLPGESFFVDPEVKAYFEARQKQAAAEHAAWQTRFEAWKMAHPEKAIALQALTEKPNYHAFIEQCPEFSVEKKVATRSAGGQILQGLADHFPAVISGSADLHGSTKNLIANGGDFGRQDFSGRNLYWGIREHAMGATMNGIAYDGFFRVSGATFLTFSDYMRPSVRLAALSKLPVMYIWTHDSVAVGEDGPTHEPVETVSSLRLIPNLHVIRPADAEEAVGGYVSALERTDGPTALILSRQDLPILTSASAQEKRQGVLKGAYVLLREKGELKIILIATGSEVQHAMKAAAVLGDGVRVVSMPCCELFEQQSAAYKESVLPASCERRIAMEAGVTALWHRYVGPKGRVIGVDRFGMSAPGDTVMEQLGIHAQAIIDAAKALGV
jgi:transketolase